MTVAPERTTSATAPAGNGRIAGIVGAVRRYLENPRWWLEILILWALYAVYTQIRNSTPDQTRQAYANGNWILDFEDKFHIAIERPLNSLADSTPWVAAVSALEYSTLHFYLTPAVLIWVMVRRKAAYRKIRTTIVMTTGLALVGFYLLPTAPPRLMGDGFTDIMAKTSSWGWWSTSGSPASEAISNQFAAMPSLHCAWAAWAGAVIFLQARRDWVRLLGLLYPFATFIAVMTTGNHYLLDVLAGIGLVAFSAIIVNRRLIWNWCKSHTGAPQAAPTAQEQSASDRAVLALFGDAPSGDVALAGADRLTGTEAPAGTDEAKSVDVAAAGTGAVGSGADVECGSRSESDG